jgi:rSAM/selenodomain-associated transferase 2
VKLSVVIPALDEVEQIEGAVASAVAEGVEVLVVDGGSRDGTPERARAAGATVISSSPGRARQLGIGVEETRGDAVLFLHADTQLAEGWESAVRRALADPRVAGGAFRFRIDDDSLRFRVVEWGTRVRVALLGLPYGDQAIFLHRAVLDAIGGVPQVPIMEDLDLVRAIKRHGRLARLPLPATTSARRFLQRGTLCTVGRNFLAAAAWMLRLDRERVAGWYRR